MDSVLLKVKKTKMNTEFNVQDSVQLLHGYTPTMTISEINSDTKQALCVWYDAHKNKNY